MKKALIFDVYDDYNIRIQYIEAALKRNGYDVNIYFADFDHVRKEYYQNKRIGVNYIHVEKYEKNLSYGRIHSHARFADSCIEVIKKYENVDLIYCMVPPNSMVKAFSKYKKEHPKVKLWFDVLDMWPESLPASPVVKFLGTPAFSLWRNTRDDHLNDGDIITTECNLFQNEVKGCVDTHKLKTIYLSQPDRVISRIPSLQDEIHFLYCGSINNIVDVDLMVSFLTQVNQKKKVTLDIIGEGEHRENFLSQLDKNHISYQFHGIVYDEMKKRDIYSNIHFGLNMMKDSVFIGLTMKSLEYLSHGIPFINNIKADTKELVEKEKIGLNLSRNAMDECIDTLVSMSDEEYRQVRKNTEKVFLEEFEEKQVSKKLDEVIKFLEVGQ